MTTLCKIDVAARWRRRAGDAWALLALAGIVVVMFWPVLFGPYWLPRGGGDNVSFLWPMYRYVAQTLRAGELPLWNPHQYTGYYLAGDNQAGIFYPFNLLLFLLRPQFGYEALQLLVIAHVFIAGAATYVCARAWRPAAPIPPAAALVGGVSFMFSDVFLTHLGNYNLIAVSAWLPLALLGLHRACTARRWWPALAAGVVVGVAALVGHGQMTFLTAFCLGLYAVYRAAADRHPWPLAALAASGAVAVGVAGIMLLPALDWQRGSARAAFTYAASTNYSLPWRALVGWVAPGFYGRGPAAFRGDWLRVEAGYAGILPLLLLAAALLPGRGASADAANRRDRWFWLGAAVFCLLLALGSNVPVHRLVFGLVTPPFQVPARFVLISDLFVALLAAAGAARLAAGAPWRWRWAWPAVGAALVAVGAGLAWAQRGAPAAAGQAAVAFSVLAAAGWTLVAARRRGWVSGTLFLWLAVGVTAADMIALGQRVEIDRGEPTSGFQADAALAYLAADAGIHRIDIATGAWQPSRAQIDGQYAIDGVFNPLTNGRTVTYLGAVGARGTARYNLLGAKYIVAGKTEPPAATPSIVPVFNEAAAVDVYLNTGAAPRVRFVTASEVVASAEDAFDRLVAADFDPTNRVILEGGRALDGEPVAHALEIRRYGANRVELGVSADAPGYVVLTDAYYPGWYATVNDEPAPIERADYLFRAVYVPAGAHTIELRFRPLSFYAGVALTLFTGVSLLGGWRWTSRRHV